MTDLPNRRECDRIRFTHGGIRYYATIGYSPDGRPSEVFLEAGKVGSEIQALARDLAVVASRALQRGDSIDGIRASLTRLDNGKPAGPLAALLDKIGDAG